MELTTALSGQTVQNVVREVGINVNHWYAVAWTKEVKPEAILPIQIWHQPIALFRDTQNRIRAVESIRPHQDVAMAQGKVQGNASVCSDHGWQFSNQGEDEYISNWNSVPRLPCAQMHSYPVQEKYGIVWLFPGDPALAERQPLPEIPEYNDPNYFMMTASAQFKAHFSICNENTMDVFHGHLHQNLQGWFDPVLIKLRETDDLVTADYRVSYKGLIAKLLGLSNHLGVTTKVFSVRFHYPHYANRLEDTSAAYLMRLPVGKTESRSLSILFLKSRAPKWLLDLLRPVLQPLIVNLLFLQFLKQDIEMIESEQKNYLRNPNRRYVEVNPAIIALQRLTVRQYEKHLQAQGQAVLDKHMTGLF